MYIICSPFVASLLLWSSKSKRPCYLELAKQLQEKTSSSYHWNHYGEGLGDHKKKSKCRCDLPQNQAWMSVMGLNNKLTSKEWGHWGQKAVKRILYCQKTCIIRQNQWFMTLSSTCAMPPIITYCPTESPPGINLGFLFWGGSWSFFICRVGSS